MVEIFNQISQILYHPQIMYLCIYYNNVRCCCQGECDPSVACDDDVTISDLQHCAKSIHENES